MTLRSTCLLLLSLGLASTTTATAAPSPVAFDPTAAQTATEQARSAEVAPVRLAQATDILSRLQQLEAEVRRLNGRVEELSFQLLQAQEDMRRAQENNEFRFQELEGGAGAAGSGDGVPQQRGDLGTGGPASSGQAAASGGAAGTGDDDIAAILGGADLGTAGTSSQPTGSVSPASSRVYDAAYDQILAGDYDQAEQSFRQYVQTYPNAPDIADAQYWLGESLFQQQRYADAAEVFLNAQKDHPDAEKAPEMMLKLGMSLAGLGSADTACATFHEVESRYPNLTDNVRNKLAQEMKSASC